MSTVHLQSWLVSDNLMFSEPVDCTVRCCLEVIPSVNGAHVQHGQPRRQQSGGGQLVRVVRMCISGWVVKEAVLLFRLALPIVSYSL